MAAQQAGRSGPHLRAADPGDREPVCRFLEQTFRESGIKAATWRRLFEHGWSDQEPGFVLIDGNAIVSFLPWHHCRPAAGERGSSARL
jgi:acetoacetyl-CoA synthetase